MLTTMGRQLANAIVFVTVVLQGSLGATRPGTVARTTASAIEGEVKDEAGQRLPGVEVVVIPQRGGVATRTTSDGNGAYHVASLRQETYRVDFWLPGFQGTRHNHVQPGADGYARVDSILVIAPLCECVQTGPSPASRTVRGHVVDEAGEPLPHALLEFAGPTRREIAWSDVEGHFAVSPPAAGPWSVIASDSGFQPVTLEVSTATTGPLVFRLRFRGAQDLPPTERFKRGCACPEYLAVDER